MHGGFSSLKAPGSLCPVPQSDLWACSHSPPGFQRTARGSSGRTWVWVQRRNVQSLSKYLLGTPLEPGALQVRRGWPGSGAERGRRALTEMAPNASKMHDLGEGMAGAARRAGSLRGCVAAAGPGPGEVECHLRLPATAVGAQLWDLRAYLIPHPSPTPSTLTCTPTPAHTPVHTPCLHPCIHMPT